MKERAYLTIYRRWMKKEKQKKNRPDGEVPCRSVFISFFPVFTYLHQYNCTMYIGDSEIICNLISGFGNKESTCII